MMERTACPEKELLVAHLYDEVTTTEQEQLAAHLAACAACREEFEAFGRVRADLAFWQVPGHAVDISLGGADGSPRDTSGRRGLPAGGHSHDTWRWVRTPAFGLAAAATLVLGLAAGMAKVEVQSDAAGWSVRTGWGVQPEAGAPARASTEAGAPALPGAPARAAARDAVPFTAAVPQGAAPGAEAWRAELEALENRLRDQLRPEAQTLQPVTGRTAAGRQEPLLIALTPEMRREIQALIDESEVRQQRNLALRVAELTRDFDLTRQADLVRIQQGLGRIEGRTEAEAQRSRDVLNYLMRVSQSPQQ